ncbi:hypothetical protein PHISP_06469 [Aspergillus sp. HF37]|nr:hypothetical protein PHISP_06469 [Aspergillus sp. HF37]
MRPATLPAQQAFPQLYIIRPDRRIVPLVALDELPSWLQIGEWDWTDISLYKGMSVATPDPVPRLGEYDVICHNCCSHIDVLHRSISQRSEAAQNSSSEDGKPSPGNPAGPAVTENKSCSGTVIHNPQHHHQSQRPAVISSGGFLPLLPLPQPAFHGYLRPALPGMCYIGVRPPCWSDVLDPSMSGGVKLPDPSISGSDSSPRRALNPEAPDFSPGSASCSPSKSRFPSLDPTPPSSMSTGSKDGPREETKKDVAGSLSASASYASSAKSNDVLPEELKRAVGIKPRRKPTMPACQRKPPMPNSPKKDKKPFQSSAKKARGRRRAKKDMRKRYGNRNVSFEPLRNSAAKRQGRRGRMAREPKEVAAGGYWHAMMVPGWAARGRR